jgi:hypothetical protein
MRAELTAKAEWNFDAVPEDELVALASGQAAPPSHILK